MRHAHVVLREAVMEEVSLTWPDGTTKTVSVQVKPQLMATVCEACGRAFEMRGRHEYLAEVHGIFSKVDVHHGNIFGASVCSYVCAERIVNGGWRALERYKDFVEFDSTIAWSTCHITSEVLFEAELVARWEDTPPTRPELRFEAKYIWEGAWPTS